MQSNTDKDFPERHLLATTAWLTEHLNAPNLRILDVGVLLSGLPVGYPYGHIPGAVYLDVRKLFTAVRGVPGSLRSVSELADVMGQLGISQETTVVIYDEGLGPIATQTFWALEYLGHTDVHILDGGLAAWKEEGRPLETTVNAPEPVTFVPKIRSDRGTTAEWILENLDNPDIVLLDTRYPQEHQEGRIPGAVNRSWDDNLLHGTVPRLRCFSELEAAYKSLGVTPDKAVICYCETGARSSHTYFVLRLMGYPRVGDYDGSWTEWGRVRQLPSERG